MKMVDGGGYVFGYSDGFGHVNNNYPYSLL